VGRIEEAAARAQARIDSGRQPIVGVNRYRLEAEDPVEIRKVDNSAVLARQLHRLRRVRAERDAAACTAALAELTAAAGRGGTEPADNLLARAIEAARAGATVGEMSAAMEQVFGRHVARIRTVSGVYRAEAGDRASVPAARAAADEFARAEGRRPRILVAKLGQDGHDRGQKVVATAFADLGFDVDVGVLFATAGEAARQAVDSDVHLVGVSSLAAGHLTLIPALRQELDALGGEHILIVVGGVIPPDDHQALYAAGAVAVFGPGTVLAEAALMLLRTLSRGPAQVVHAGGGDR
jgi:methylmalonyl-CoA mutase